MAREKTAQRIARARIAAADEASAEPLRAADRGGVYKIPTPGANMPMAEWPASVPTMRDLMELARATTHGNIRTLVEIRDSDAPPMVRVAAAGMLMDRGFGRAHQSIAIADVTDRGKLDLSALSGDELRVFEQLLTKASAPAIDVTPGQPASRGVLPSDD